MKRTTIGLCVLLLARIPAAAQAAQIDTRLSTMTVKVGKSGLFSAFGHNHEIRAPIASGKLARPASPSVELNVDVRRMEVLDPDLSAKDRAEVQTTMLGAAVLDSERFPEIRFASRTIEATGAKQYRVTGDLTLHGVTRPVVIRVEENGNHYSGSATVKQSDFGIKPVNIAGGTVRVKDAVTIVFDIAAAAQSPAAAPGVERPAATGRSSTAMAAPSR